MKVLSKGALLTVLVSLFSSHLIAADLRLNQGEIVRLPSTQQQLNFHSLFLAEKSVLVIPREIKTLIVEDLLLAKQARISITARTEPLMIAVQKSVFRDGSAIVGRGLNGAVGVRGGDGANVILSLQKIEIDNLTIDLRGGHGGAGWNGILGVDGEDASCFGKSATAGTDGGNGGEGAQGGNGGNIEFSLVAKNALEVIDIIQFEGHGGVAGLAGVGGKDGAAANCFAYAMDAAPAGKDGVAGRAGESGYSGLLRVK